MDIRRFVIPLATSVVVGVIVYALSLISQQSLRAELEQLKTLHSEMDKRFSDVTVLADKLNAVETRLLSIEKPVGSEAAAPAPTPTEPTAPAAPPQQ
jgi:hypothetical protein